MKHRHQPKFRPEDISEAEGMARALHELFPDFPDAELVEDLAAGEANHHTVLGEFRGNFREDLADPIQIQGLAKLIEMSLLMEGDVENAWMTCFLEHRPRSGRLWSRFSTEAKKYIKTH